MMRKPMANLNRSADLDRSHEPIDRSCERPLADAIDPHRINQQLDRHIGRRLRARRRELEMSQEQLAAALDLSYQQIYKYEQGANRVPASQLFAIARILGVSVVWFFEEFDMPRRP